MIEITQKLRQKGLEKLKPLVEQLISESMDKNKIIYTAKRYTESKVNNYYTKTLGLQQINPLIKKALDTVMGKQEDSRAEAIFYYLLVENGIDFQFQYQIGPYRADYLVGEDLVVELDGPLHDKASDKRRDNYLRKMGYRVLRIPIFVVSLSLEAVIKEIKEAA